MKTIIISLISLSLISACEVNVDASGNNPSPLARTIDPEVPAISLVQPDPLPTSDPFEAFLMPSSFQPTLTKASEVRNATSNLDALKFYFRDGSARVMSDPRYLVYNAYIESSDGSQVEHAAIFLDTILNYMMLCASNSPSEMWWSCSMLIRNVKWINSNTASYEICHRQTTGAMTGYATESSCVTKYSNE